jgi:hypothetical protein
MLGYIFENQKYTKQQSCPQEAYIAFKVIAMLIFRGI